MQIIAYYPFVYSLLLVGIGYLYARRVEKSFIFWIFVAVAELNRVLAIIFLVQNLGMALYKFQLEELYGLLFLSLVMSLVGLIAHRKKFFPGLWLAGLSILQAVVATVLLFYYSH